MQGARGRGQGDNNKMPPALLGLRKAIDSAGHQIYT